MVRDKTVLNTAWLSYHRTHWCSWTWRRQPQPKLTATRTYPASFLCLRTTERGMVYNIIPIKRLNRNTLYIFITVYSYCMNTRLRIDGIWIYLLNLLAANKNVVWSRKDLNTELCAFACRRYLTITHRV